MLGYGGVVLSAAVCGVTIYIPSRVGNHDNAWGFIFGACTHSIALVTA